MWIEREISPELHAAARTFPAVAVIGPRQVGKTSLLERAFPDHRLVSLDLPTMAELAETRPTEFLARFAPPVIIDEVQYAPGLFRYIKAAIDAEPSARGRFILTGSQSYNLMESLSESLAGRVAILDLVGLSGREWAAASHIDHADWFELLWRGSYPGLWADPEHAPSRERWYQAYVATYLERDVRRLLNVGSLRDFERFLRAAAVRNGQLLNMSDLARDVGISPTTARQWLSVLQASNVVMLLEPYHRSLGKRLVKTPKLYFSDTGLPSFLMGYQSVRTLREGPHAGALFETHVVGQFMRHRAWHRPELALWFWQDRSGAEVDLVVEVDQRLVAIECKLAETPDARDTKGLAKLRAFYGDAAVAACYVACTGAHPHEVVPGVEARPGWVVFGM